MNVASHTVWAESERATVERRARGKVECVFAWLHDSRRIVTRGDYHLEIFPGFVQLGCILILL